MIAFSRSRRTWMPKMFRKSYKTILVFPRAITKQNTTKTKQTTSPRGNSQCSSGNSSCLIISRMWARMSVSLTSIRSHLSTSTKSFSASFACFFFPPVVSSSFSSSSSSPDSAEWWATSSSSLSASNQLQDRICFSTLNSLRAQCNSWVIPAAGPRKRRSVQNVCETQLKYFKLVFRLLSQDIDRVAPADRDCGCHCVGSKLEKALETKLYTRRTRDCSLLKIRWTVVLEQSTEDNTGTRNFIQNRLKTPYPNGALLSLRCTQIAGPMQTLSVGKM